MGDWNAPADPRASALTESGVVLSAEHRLRGIASSARREQTEPTRVGYRRRILRDVLVLAFVILVAVAIQPFADVPNPDYPEAAEIADRLESAWRSVVRDGVDAEEAAAAEGLRVFFFELDDGGVRTVYTHVEPTETEHCYAVRRGPNIATEAGILEEPGPGCTPQPAGLMAESGSWEEILPSERMTTDWYIPVMVLLSAVALYALTDIPLTVLTKSR